MTTGSVWVMGDIARRVVYDYVKARLEKTDTHVNLELNDVYVVWSCYVLGNWKVLVSTPLADGMYYEVTHDRNKNTVYIDAYRKWENVEVELDADGGPSDRTQPRPVEPHNDPKLGL